MPVSLEQRLLLRQLGIDPSFSNDQFHGGLYGQPDAMSSGGVPMMQQDTRDWRALGGGGNTPSPTRMSQPVIGGQIGPDANDIRQQANVAKYQQELDAIQSLSRGARPIIEGTMTPGTGLTDGSTVPNRSRQILDQLEAMPNVPESTRQQMAFAGLNTGSYDRMMDGPKPLYSDQKRADLATQQKVAQGNRAADLATRRNAVQDRARRKGEARDVRMEGGGALMADKQMQMLQMLSGGGSGGPAAMGPGGSPDPALATMLFGPQVASMYIYQQRNAADAARGNRAVAVQEKQNELQGEANKLQKDKFALDSMPNNLQNLVGPRALRLKGKIEDSDVLQAIQMARSAGHADYGNVLKFVQEQGIPTDQATKVLDLLAPPTPEPTSGHQAVPAMAPPSMANEINRRNLESAWGSIGQYPPTLW